MTAREFPVKWGSLYLRYGGEVIETISKQVSFEDNYNKGMHPMTNLHQAGQPPLRGENGDYRQERELIERIRRGDEASFEELFQRYHNLILHLWGKHTVHFISFEDWEQEAALTIYQSAMAYQRRKNCFAKYVKHRLENRLCDFAREGSLQRSVPLTGHYPLDSLRVEEKREDMVPVDELAHYRHCQQRYLRHLSPLEANSYHLRRRGYRLEEIAVKLDTSMNSVRAAISRANRKIHRLVEREGWLRKD